VSTTLRTSGGDLVLPRVIITDPAACAVSAINDGLALWRGSFYLDLNAGFPWLQFLGQKIVSDNQIVAALKAFLMSVPGIVSVVATATFDRTARAFSYTYQATFNPDVIITGGSGQPAAISTGSS
jgi:hypothetical protein